MIIKLFLCILLVSISTVLITRLIKILKHKKQENIFLKDFISGIKNLNLFFIDMKLKSDGNILYFVNCGHVLDLDEDMFQWVVLDYTIDNENHVPIKLPTCAVFLTIDEANAFLNGEFTLTELQDVYY